MGMTLQTAITTARAILNDPQGVTYSDADLLSYGNDGLSSLVDLAPKLFYARGDVTCVTGEIAQSVSFSGLRAIVSVDRVVGGPMITKIDKAALDRFNPAWPSVTPATAQHWMARADSPVKFYIYPPAPAGQVLEITYTQVPARFTALQDTGVPDFMAPAIADYIVAMTMSRDDEHINANRAQAFLTSFAQRAQAGG